jgi:hypothetical protein
LLSLSAVDALYYCKPWNFGKRFIFATDLRTDGDFCHQGQDTEIAQINLRFRIRKNVRE